ncbi:hypothetical protein QFZ55_000848 [Streptomyces luteogriseus]|nr:hypothetical protein [Streptomyces luteogriseus]
MEDDDILDTAEGPQPRPQSLMLTFFGNHVLEEGDLGVYSGSIIDVLGRVGVGEQAVRSTLTRMVNRGLLQRQREGRKMFFGLTPQASRVLIDGRTRIWKQGAVNDDWDGSWTLLGFSLPDSWKRQRHDLRSRLTWSGFGALYSGLWIAPGHVDVSAVVIDLGLTAHVKIFHAQAAEVTDIEQMIRDTWDLESIARPLRHLRQALERPPGKRHRPRPDRHPPPPGERLAPDHPHGPETPGPPPSPGLAGPPRPGNLPPRRATDPPGAEGSPSDSGDDTSPQLDRLRTARPDEVSAKSASGQQESCHSRPQTATLWTRQPRQPDPASCSDALRQASGRQ